MADDRTQEVLQYRRNVPSPPPRQRPDACFGIVSAASFGLFITMGALLGLLSRPGYDEGFWAQVVIMALCPCGIASAILGLVFDRRHQWISVLFLPANIFSPAVLAGIFWIFRLLRLF